MRTTWMSVSLLLAACAGDNDSAGDATDAGGAGPYIVEPANPDLPSVDTAVLAAGIEEALDALFTFDLTPVTVGYQAIMDEIEDGCPIWAVSEGNPYWTASCTTSAGTSFDGYGAVVDYADIETDDGLEYAGHLVNSISTVVTADGEVFTADGTAYAMQSTNGTEHHVAGFGTTSGFDWTGPAGDDSWMKADPQLDFNVLQITAEGYQLLTVEGTISALDSVQAVVFQQLSAVDHAGRSPGCEREPYGSVAVLDTQGNWFDIQFEGMDGDGNIDPDVGCDRCATAWFKGHPLDEVCLNAEAIFEWSL
jgi:hypothetical protein